MTSWWQDRTPKTPTDEERERRTKAMRQEVKDMAHEARERKAKSGETPHPLEGLALNHAPRSHHPRNKIDAGRGDKTQMDEDWAMEGE